MAIRARRKFFKICVFGVITLSYTNTSYAKTPTEHLISAAFEVGVDPDMLIAICTVESSLRPYVTGDDKTSHGLCQLKSATARDFHPRVTVRMLYQPRLNALIAAKYLKWCKKHFNKWSLTLTCYNTGYGNTKRYGTYKPYVRRVYAHIKNSYR